MDGKEDAKEEAKGPSLSREDLLKYIKRLKTKVKGLEDDKVQSGNEMQIAHRWRVCKRWKRLCNAS